jgi:hypothetical protein
MPPCPSVLSPTGITFLPPISHLPSERASSWEAYSTLATAHHESVLTCCKQVEPWPSGSTMWAKTSSRSWAGGQAPHGSPTFMHKSLPSLQVCQNAWSFTMYSTMSVHNSSVPLPWFPRVPSGTLDSPSECPNTLQQGQV